MIHDEATRRQIAAADPRVSTWLSANAGSGKTRVLTDRVARLLYLGVSPQNVLCLTYTKAAAAEMQNRLFKRLGGWAMLGDEDLRTALRELGIEETIAAHDLARARTLFASAIETPGGLKIQTIHSFCASVLRRFPLESGVSPAFRELDDRAAAELRTQVLDALAEDAPEVVTPFLAQLGGIDLDPILRDIAGQAEAFATPRDEADFRAHFDVPDGVTLDGLLADLLGPDGTEIIRDLIPVLRGGGPTDNKNADTLSQVSLTDPGPADLALLEKVFLTGATAKVPFGAKIGTIPTKALQKANLELTDALNGLMAQVEAAREPRLGLLAARRSAALHRFARAFNAAYAEAKMARGVLDFDDLITRARDLLANPAVADWVLFRLDGGMNHLLVDEAQDTSPRQWDLVRHLTRELLSGTGARADEGRTIFVVGDVKQSIYSFQGADPDAFQDMRALFDAGLVESDAPLVTSTLEHSFRSAPAVLRVVDEVFVRDRAEALGGPVRHLAFKTDMPGRVDLWPLIEPAAAEKEDDPGLLDPVDEVSEDHHLVQMARRVAQQIRRMIDHETLPEEIGHSGTYNHRPITPGDFLILVQRRDAVLFPELIRACKAEGLDIAGADVLRVGAELAVKDIAAVLRFLALPEDDLSLAAALRSPLFGWSEQQLYTLAHHRPKGAFLWQALRNSEGHPQTVAILNDLRRQADFLRPYDLIARLLTRHAGRQNLLARLGSEAEDGIDALLAQALAYESDGVPSLTGFLAWMDTDDLTIKRQVDSAGDQIRVMTVHGAKGLEAPIVILPDAAERPERLRGEILAGAPPVWKTPAAEMPDAMIARADAIKAAEARENLRLLYVAMTRAEKWLIVGSAGKPGTDMRGWYDLVSDGMTQAGAGTEAAGDLAVQRVESGAWQPGDLIRPDRPTPAQEAGPTLIPLPDPPVQRTLSPSDLKGAKVLPGDPADLDLDVALMRGTLMHLLLEHLPAQPPPARADIGARLLATFPGADEVPTEDLVADALAILDTPDLGWIFDDTLAEVDVTAALPDLGGARIHGSIDRLIVTEKTVTAVDFKTNRLIPDTPQAIPEGLLRQMGAYAQALDLIFPDRRVETAILWTAKAQLMPVPAELARAALVRAGAS
ncbi:double-strand break repair helicase AddA [Salipiger sp. IMCC34102]|uniref:double-strand break repair helicase AddA n=1 Tax=Salipiger sp. IMCC34102 TaxID=2510647 RepID=UPI00101C74FA|nr:double-strand break repair helicase AddA [Salipiger sp. IMCC34102]RYH04231.1 double-strand break repair helicase AddA [Salipiger sp. IMCC34102]